MRWKENKPNEKNYLFSSYYCWDCKQKKPCHLFTRWNSKLQIHCCSCYYQQEKNKAQEYSNYQQVLIIKQQERKRREKQLLALKNYSNCKNCQSQEVDAYELYENDKLTCWKCLMDKENCASSPISFNLQQKWYQKQWKIDVSWCLTNYQYLPENFACAKLWLKDQEHLVNCQCLEVETQELYTLFTNYLKEIEQKLTKCACKISQKVRISNDFYTSCEICAKSIPVASKKRVIKNRNDPRFWGLVIKAKILCGDCLANYQEIMPPLRYRKKYLFKEYQKRGYWDIII